MAKRPANAQDKQTATSGPEGHEHLGPVADGETTSDDGRAYSAPPEPDGSVMMIGEHILVVSAPAGPRRRAGFGFGPTPIDLPWEELGATDEERQKTLDRLRSDPMLKIDGRIESRPAED